MHIRRRDAVCVAQTFMESRRRDLMGQQPWYFWQNNSLKDETTLTSLQLCNNNMWPTLFYPLKRREDFCLLSEMLRLSFIMQFGEYMCNYFINSCIHFVTMYLTSPSRAWLRLNAFSVLACFLASLLAYLLTCLLACLLPCLLACFNLTGVLLQLCRTPLQCSFEESAGQTDRQTTFPQWAHQDWFCLLRVPWLSTTTVLTWSSTPVTR